MTAVLEKRPIGITVSDVSGQKRANVDRIPEDISVADLVEGLIKSLNMPKNDSTGRPLSYQARLEREGRHLNGGERVKEALKQDDHVVLQPNVDAG